MILLAAASVSTRAAWTNDAWDKLTGAVTADRQDCWFTSYDFEYALDSPDVFGLISAPGDSCPHTTAIALGEVRPGSCCSVTHYS